MAEVSIDEDMFGVGQDNGTGFSDLSGRLGKLNLPSLASLHRYGTSIDSVMPVVSTVVSAMSTEVSTMATVMSAVVSTIMPTMTSVIPAVTAVESAVAAVVIVPKSNADSAAVAVRRLCIDRLIRRTVRVCRGIRIRRSSVSITTSVTSAKAAALSIPYLARAEHGQCWHGNRDHQNPIHDSTFQTKSGETSFASCGMETPFLFRIENHMHATCRQSADFAGLRSFAVVTFMK